MSAVTVQEIVEALLDADTPKSVALAKYIEAHGIAPPDGMVLVENKPIGYCNLNEVKRYHKREQSALLWGRDYSECDAVVYAAPEVKP